MTPIENFKAVAPKWMHMLLKDFPKLNKEDAAAVFGNAGYESKGLTDDQEDKPVVKGSRGGANWMQWTGPRRVAMEKYAARNNYDPNSDEVAYKWLFIELKTTESKAINALIAAPDLDAKTEAFEKNFLRAGVKNYEKRKEWSRIALQAYNEWLATPVPDEPTKPLQPRPKPVQGKPWWQKSIWEILNGK